MYMQKIMKFNPYLISYTKSNSKCITGLCVNLKLLKFLEENRRYSFFFFFLSWDREYFLFKIAQINIRKMDKSYVI